MSTVKNMPSGHIKVKKGDGHVTWPLPVTLLREYDIFFISRKTVFNITDVKCNDFLNVNSTTFHANRFPLILDSTMVAFA